MEAFFWDEFGIIRLPVKTSNSFTCCNVWWLSILGFVKRDTSYVKCNIKAFLKNNIKGLIIVRFSNSSSSLIIANCVKKISLKKSSVIYDDITSSLGIVSIQLILKINNY